MEMEALEKMNRLVWDYMNLLKEEEGLIYNLLGYTDLLSNQRKIEEAFRRTCTDKLEQIDQELEKIHQCIGILDDIAQSYRCAFEDLCFDEEKFIAETGEQCLPIKEMDIPGLGPLELIDGDDRTVADAKAAETTFTPTADGAFVVDNIQAPLLLGQTALSKFGKVTINYNNNTIEFN